MIFLLFIFSVAVLFGILTAYLAQRKGHDPTAWFFFGALLFIVALPLALTLKPKGRTQASRNCPYCGAGTGGKMECPECGRGQPNIGAATTASWERTIAMNDEVEKWNQKQK